MRKAYIVTDLGYGDCGKGTVTDALARRLPSPPIVVRHNGGPQAAHNVVTAYDLHHTFSQFGSATFLPGAITYLSRFCLINPLNIMREAQVLHDGGVQDALQRLCIDKNAVVITPYHKALNRVQELARGAKRHGSCGQGIGTTMASSQRWPLMALQLNDLYAPKVTRDKLEFWRDVTKAEAKYLKVDTVESKIFEDDDLIPHLVQFYYDFAVRVSPIHGGLGFFMKAYPDTDFIFEGAQGVLLDEWYGFHPYTTWSTTTTKNARAIMDDYKAELEVTSIGVIRAYQTRHGPGPFVTEGAINAPEPDNGMGVWQGKFRKGWLDAVATRYALEVAGGIDTLAITHLDTVDPIESLRVCMSYDTVERLIPSPERDLTYQGRLRTICERSVPQYQSVRKTDRALSIANILGLPLLMEGWGRRTDQKVWH